MRHRRKRKGKRQGGKRVNRRMSIVNPDAAGIDVGARSVFAAVAPGQDPEGQDVREYPTFISDLKRLAEWLEACGVTTIAMESTGVYWIPVYEVLEQEGFEVCLVDAHQIKNVSGRKSDVSDSEWIQQLHSYGLLRAAFRPAERVCALRSYQRQRSRLVQSTSRQVQHMQKAMTQMGLQLQHVISDITGKTGMLIVRSIVEGERDPKCLAQYRDGRCHASEETIAKSLEGNYREEHVFELSQALEIYDFYLQQIVLCDRKTQEALDEFEDCSSGESLAPKPPSSNRASNPQFDLRTAMYRMTVDLTEIPGFDALSACKLVSEIGLDMGRWKSAPHFVSWLALCPNNKKTGGRIFSRKTKPSSNRAATTLRIAASTLYRSQTALGAFYRRKKAQIGPAAATTATAHKLARIVFAMLSQRADYQELGANYYDEMYRERVLKSLKRRALHLGFELTPVLAENP